MGSICQAHREKELETERDAGAGEGKREVGRLGLKQGMGFIGNWLSLNEQQALVFIWKRFWSSSKFKPSQI